MERAHALLLAIAVVLMAPVGFVVADSLTHSASAGVTYETSGGEASHDTPISITLGDGRDVQRQPFVDEHTWTTDTVTVSGKGGTSVTVTDETFEGDQIRVEDLGVFDSSSFDGTTEGELTVERSDLDRSLSVTDGDAAVLEMYDPGVDDGEIDYAYTDSVGGLEIEVSGLPTGIEIAAVDASTGEVLDSVEDSTDTERFSLPESEDTRNVRLEALAASLEVRNEVNPDEVIDENATLRFRAYFEEDGETQVIEREVENGRVSLEGLPKDQQVTVTVREENANFVFRRIILDQITEQSEIYLLPTDEPAAEVEFRVEDQTGRFSSENTRMYVEKAVRRDGNTQYRVISGDELTAGGAFPTILQDSERYRLRVENDDGEQRILGTYVVQGAQTEPIPIGDVQFGADIEDGAAMQASLREAADGADHNHEARIVYADPSGETDELEISIEDSDGNELRPTTSETLSGDADIYVETFPLEDGFDPEEDTATVTVEATSGLETETFERTLGDIPDVFQDVPINPQLLELLALGSIVAVIGLLVIVSPPLAALVGPGYAGLLVLIGLAPIPMPAVVLAGVVGVLAVVGNNRVIR